MLKDISRIVLSYVRWIFFKGLYGIKKDTVILALGNENLKLDSIAVKRFPEFLDRGYAKKGVILVPREIFDDIICNDARVKVIRMKSKRMKDYFSLYCFYSFTSNIVFTYVNTPKDNNLSDYIKKSDIKEEDIVGIALFRLGNV